MPFAILIRVPICGPIGETMQLNFEDNAFIYPIPLLALASRKYADAKERCNRQLTVGDKWHLQRINLSNKTAATDSSKAITAAFIEYISETIWGNSSLHWKQRRPYWW